MTKRFLGLTVVAVVGMALGVATPAWASLSLTVDPVLLGSVHVDNTGTSACTTCSAASVTAVVESTGAETYTSITMVGTGASSDTDCTGQISFNPTTQLVSSAMSSPMTITYHPIKKGALTCTRRPNGVSRR